jgi:hypothetical protein
MRHIETTYAALVAAADAGLPCPSNFDLADLTGIACPSTLSEHLARLERAGRIKVHRAGGNRAVTILESGRTTGWTAKVPKKQLEDRVDPLSLPKVYRDPCPACGVRGDIPCRHKPAWRNAELQQEMAA